MLNALLRKGLPAAVCTIYDPRYPEPAQRRVGTAALCIINDCIIREAAIAGVPLIDLRAVCGDDADFANPIEPSVQGGSKMRYFKYSFPLSGGSRLEIRGSRREHDRGADLAERLPDRHC